MKLKAALGRAFGMHKAARTELCNSRSDVLLPGGKLTGGSCAGCCTGGRGCVRHGLGAALPEEQTRGCPRRSAEPGVRGAELGALRCPIASPASPGGTCPTCRSVQSPCSVGDGKAAARGASGNFNVGTSARYRGAR